MLKFRTQVHLDAPITEPDHLVNKEYVDSVSKNAYQLAKDNGFVGTEKEWLSSLRSVEPLIPQKIEYAIFNIIPSAVAPTLTGDSINGYDIYNLGIKAAGVAQYNIIFSTGYNPITDTLELQCNYNNSGFLPSESYSLDEDPSKLGTFYGLSMGISGPNQGNVTIQFGLGGHRVGHTNGWQQYAVGAFKCRVVKKTLGSSAPVLDYYASTTGSDTTGDGTQSNPWKTIMYSINQIKLRPQIGQYLNLRLSDGTYIEDININNVNGLKIIGNITDSTKVIIQSATLNTSGSLSECRIHFQYIKFTTLLSLTTWTSFLIASVSSDVRCSNCIFDGSNQWLIACQSSNGGRLFLDTCKIYGSRWHDIFESYAHGILVIYNTVINSNMTLDTIIVAYNGGKIHINSLSGSVTVTGKKYDVYTGGMITGISAFTQTSTVAGTTATGGTVY